MSTKSTEPIVISGISGRLPESDSIEEFKQNLLDGIDMVTTDDGRRWSGDYHFKNRSGKLKHLNRFDTNFFGVHAKQAETMDPQSRILLEVTYEAIIDAGLNTQELKGSKTGVYVGCSTNESLHYWTNNVEESKEYAITGCSKAMFANRISYTFDFKGPSFCMDAACSSSMVALKLAVDAIQSGQCDSAIVAGVNLLLNPAMTLQFNHLKMLSSDGMCKPFDASGNGYVRSETVIAVLLQRASSARRVYANILGIKTNTDGNKEQGITFPSAFMQSELLKEVFLETGVNPLEVKYVEAHGTGTLAGDPQEMNGIIEVYCRDEREKPLLIGSVKSNMGHSEPASGLCGLAKVVIAMESGVIPANLHYEKPSSNISGLVDEKVKIVTNNQKWNAGLVGISSFGFGGSNAHALLSPNSKLKPNLLRTNIPNLLTISGRTEEAVKHFFRKINELDFNPELYALINQIHKLNIFGHNFRGFQIEGAERIIKVNKVGNEKPPIWFIFTGMGCQWLGMGKDLMKLEVLKKSLEHSAIILKPHGIDLMDILISESPDSLSNIQKSFVAITAVQIALVDLLKSINIEADGMIGHSVGEIACSYADDTLTHEQAIILSFIRGSAILETNLPKGLMASVGLTWEDFHNRAPSDIFAACHNSKDNLTCSGPPESITNFLTELNKEGIFSKSVDVFGHAFHSKYIADAEDHLRKAASALIPNPKKRSRKWISSSVLQENWDKPLAKTSSADYHVNNLLSPVYFYEATMHIPEDAVVLEIGPHALLQAILKRSLPKSVTNIGLLKRQHTDNIHFLLSNIGKLYISGGHPNISSLYPPVNFPVSRGTPMLGNMIKWDHSAEWLVPDFTKQKSKSGQTVFMIDLSKDEYKYLRGHTIDGRILFPATGYLTLVWKTFAKLRNQNFEEFPVRFEDVKFLRATILQEEGSVGFLISIFEGSGEFEVYESGAVAVSGKIFHMKDSKSEFLEPIQQKMHNEKYCLSLNSNDVYKELRLRGYNYDGAFKGIIKSETCGLSGSLSWENRWETFMDTMLQFWALKQRTRKLRVPSRILKILIDPREHADLQQKEIPVHILKNDNVVKSGGIEITGLTASLAPRKPQALRSPKLEKYEFVPFINSNSKDVNVALTIASQLVFENCGDASKLKVVEILGQHLNIDTLLKINEIIESEPELHADCTIVASYNVKDSLETEIEVKDLNDGPIENYAHLFVLNDVLLNKNKEVLAYALASLKQAGFILFKESKVSNFDFIKNNDLTIVYQQTTAGETFVLVTKIKKTPDEHLVIKITSDNYDWVELVKKSMENELKIYLISQGEHSSGLIGLIKCLSKEPGGSKIRSFLIKNKSNPFSVSSTFYKQQLEKGLSQNVLIDETWGTFRHLPLENFEKRLVKHAYVNTLSSGDLSSFQWIESDLNQNEYIHDLNKKCDIYYTALNFKDVMLATGKLTEEAFAREFYENDSLLGFEFSGIKLNGERIMGMVSNKALATSVLIKHFVWEVPEDWSLEEAATIPAVYVTCYYALIMRGKMKTGESILIHAGSGGVGLTAITIALRMGCKVYTTVGSQSKRDFLKSNFPQLTDECIGNSRDKTFEQMINNQTNGQGVDLVLNSLAGELLLASVRCLAINGRFLEIGKADMANDSLLGLSVFIKNVSFHGIMLEQLITVENEDALEIKRLVTQGIASGEVRPLRRTVFLQNQVEDAFRYMASAKHMGKVILKIRDEFEDKGKDKTIQALSMCYFDPQKVIIIIGGLGGFGLELTNWLVARGARNIVLSSRNGIQTGYQAFCIRRWREANVNITISKEDVTTETGVRKLLQESSLLGIVEGIFNLAVVLNDALIINQTLSSFQQVCKPKAETTNLLDSLSRILTPDLKYFVVFSSVSSGRGNAGQSSYGYSNSTMERICENRKIAGLPALAIQWGAIGDVGLVAENMSGLSEVRGTSLQSINSCLSTLNTLLLQPNPVVSSFVLANKGNQNLNDDKMKLVKVVANILGINDTTAISGETTLGDLGMDSLMCAEIKQVLEGNFDLVLDTQEIRYLTFNNLEELENTKGSNNTHVNGLLTLGVQ